MSEYYDKGGAPLELMEWADIYEHGKDGQSRSEYKRVAETTLSDGKWISTVWLGLDHQFGDGPPLIFETMVFTSPTNMDEQEVDRYSTLTEAEEGHKAMVLRWNDGVPA